MAFFADDSSLPHLQFEVLAKGKGKGEGSRGGHILGHTKSGKPIYASATAHPGYTKQDHLDAADKHNALARKALRAAQRKSNGSALQMRDAESWGQHGSIARWHQGEAYRPPGEQPPPPGSAHGPTPQVPAMAGMSPLGLPVRKSKGEGSRGGHILGHTKAGKPIYSSGAHAESFTRADHNDAADAHYAAVDNDPKEGQQVHLDAAAAHQRAAATGRTGTTLGNTGSGKAIHADGPKAAVGFSAADHADASRAHSAEAQRIEAHAQQIEDAGEGDHPDYAVALSEAADHRDHAADHANLAKVQKLHRVVADLEKAARGHGEGSRGGHIIGHTKSGKPVYAATNPKYSKLKEYEPGQEVKTALSNAKRTRSAYPRFTLEDHDDAADFHRTNAWHHREQGRLAEQDGHQELAGLHRKIEVVHDMAREGHKQAQLHMRDIGHDYPRHVYHEAGMHAEMDKRPIRISDYGEIRDPFRSKSSLEQIDARAHNQHAVGQNFGHFSLKQHQEAIKHHQDMGMGLESYVNQAPEHKRGGRKILSDKKVKQQIQSHRALALAHSDYANKKFSNPGV